MKSKRHRRYREKPGRVTVAASNGDRIHDFFKGWGTLCKDGSILWDWWRPPTKKHIAKFQKMKFDKWTFPIIKKVSMTSITEALTSVQPMQEPP